MFLLCFSLQEAYQNESKIRFQCLDCIRLYLFEHFVCNIYPFELVIYKTISLFLSNVEINDLSLECEASISLLARAVYV